jgi:hypothetical protein
MYKYLYRIAVVTTMLVTEDMNKVYFSDATNNRLRFSYSTLGLARVSHQDGGPSLVL